jgi:hypothetical protein
MNFDQLFEPRLELIRSENRYRGLGLERCAGHFPQAFDHRLQDQVTVWYFQRLPAWASIRWCLQQCMKLDRVGAGAGGRATFREPAITMCSWRMSLPACTARKALLFVRIRGQ